ncbi:hypothetical protein NFI96_004287 [Prochilodus magdalenae]|nr:hypothetical protein NFI96_004287 [Prochilodus magdalenae]
MLIPCDYLRYKIEGNEVTIPVSNAIKHPKYNPVTVDNDIALMRLASPVKFTNYILPACLPSRSLAERVLHLNGTQTVVTGWGKQNETASHFSSALGFINIPLVEHAVCARHMVNNLTQNVLCAGIIGKVRDACEGDSGGPMMTRYHNTWFLIGLVSWGEGCGRTDKLGIYTKVSNYMDWIDSVRKEGLPVRGAAGSCEDRDAVVCGTMARRPVLCFGLLIVFWAATALSKSAYVLVFYSSTKAHMLLRSKRANSLLEEIKPASMERECVEETCDFEEAREIFKNRESTLEFWVWYVGLPTDGPVRFPEAQTLNCSVNNGHCDHECQEGKGKIGRFCSCVHGYKLNKNSKSCIPNDQEACGQILIAKSAYSTIPQATLMPWVSGGEIGQRGASPWQALVLNAYGRFHCGGVLIDENWVLTAAHCFETTVRFAVRLGDYLQYKTEGSEVTIIVSKAIPHPEYNPVTADNDIALLRLGSPVKFNTYILPACLPSRSLAERMLHLNGTQTVVTGWGKQNETHSHYSSALSFVTVPLVDHAECARHMVNNLTQNMLCAGIIGKVRDACEGDSGGPMMTRYHNTWFLIGLVSWGEGCGHKDKLGVYTKVSNYMDWIDSVRKEVAGS